MKITHNDESITIDHSIGHLDLPPFDMTVDDLTDLIEYAIDNALIDDPTDKYRWAFEALMETMALIREGDA